MLRLLAKHADGSPNFDCRSLTAPPDAVGRKELRNAIVDLLAHEADVALFHFSGHGMIKDLGGYLVTQDAEQYDEGVEMDEVVEWANEATKRIREVIVLLDCCHSGAIGSPPPGTGKVLTLKEGVSVLAATRQSQPAIEEGGGGIFTSLVLDALRGGAADIRGNVSIAAVYSYVDQSLGAWDQRPMFRAHVSRMLPLRRCEPPIDLELLRLLPEYFESPQAEHLLDPSYEPDAKPRNRENEKIFSHLQRLRAVRLVVPVGEEHMYYAAMNSKSCKLTPLGQFYWRLASEGRL